LSTVALLILLTIILGLEHVEAIQRVHKPIHPNCQVHFSQKTHF